jgi:hypothetical protein
MADQSPSVAPGYYADGQHPGLRFWNGTEWTDKYQGQANAAPSPARVVTPVGVEASKRAKSSRSPSAGKPNKLWFALGGSAVLILAIAGAALYFGHSSSSKKPSQNSVLFAASGVGDKTYFPFSTAGAWRLQYSFTCPNGASGFQLSNHLTGQNYVQQSGSTGAAAITVPESLTSIQLQVTTACSWTLRLTTMS